MRRSDGSRASGVHVMAPLLMVAACLSMASPHAHAATGSVHIQGVLDVGVRRVQNDDAMWTLSNDGVSGSQLVVRGEENLGNSYGFGFWLESGVQLDAGIAGGSNGITTAFFNRRSTLHVDTPVGQVRLGRDYTPSYWNISRFDPFKTNGVANANNLEPTTNSLGSSAFTLLRANNSIAFFTKPTGTGLFLHLMAAAGEGTQGGKYLGARAGVLRDEYEFAVSAARTRADAIGNHFSVVNLGGTYNLDWIKPSAFYQRVKYLSRRQDNWLVGAAFPIGRTELRVSYQRADQQGAGTNANDATQIGVGLLHRLSKRTALYATVSKVSNSGVQGYRASSAGGRLTPGQESRGTEAGMQHIF